MMRPCDTAPCADVSPADLVRHAVALSAKLPAGHIRRILDREQTDRVAAALESFHWQLQPLDLPNHLAAGRCPGRGEPPRAALWFSWPEARALVRSGATLSRLVTTGLVRSRGRRRSRQYLARDLVQIRAWTAMLRGSL